MLLDSLVGHWRNLEVEGNVIDALWIERCDAGELATVHGDMRSGLRQAISNLQRSLKLLSPGPIEYRNLGYEGLKPKLVARLLLYCLAKSGSSDLTDFHILRNNIFDPRQTDQKIYGREYVDIWDEAWNELERLSIGFDINFQIFPEDDETKDCTYLIAATRMGNVATVRLVLERKPDLHMEDADGHTAFYYAAEGHHFDIMICLLDNCKRRPRIVFDGTSLLHLLCTETWQRDESVRLRQTASLKKLLNTWCTVEDTDIADTYGLNPIDVADIFENNAVREVLETFRKNRKLS
jgi:hypothetical protein